MGERIPVYEMGHNGPVAMYDLESGVSYSCISSSAKIVGMNTTGPARSFVPEHYCEYCGQRNDSRHERGCWACGAPLP